MIRAVSEDLATRCVSWTSVKGGALAAGERCTDGSLAWGVGLFVRWRRVRIRRADGDFFVSYAQEDRAWAEWIAWILEEDGHRILVQAWDFATSSDLPSMSCMPIPLFVVPE